MFPMTRKLYSVVVVAAVVKHWKSTYYAHIFGNMWNLSFILKIHNSGQFNNKESGMEEIYL